MTWNSRRTLLAAGICWCVISCITASTGCADPPAAAPAAPPAGEKKPATAEEADIKYLTKENDLWVNMKKHEVGMKGKVTKRTGIIDTFACSANTKEYESIIGISLKAAFPVHAALVAVGAQPGSPSWFDVKERKFHPAKGPEIEVLVRWKDEKGASHETHGQDWVRNAKTGKASEFHWVFGGSHIGEFEGKKTYSADGGDMICTVNFPDAMMEPAVESPRAWEDHEFEPFTEHIPAVDTEVELVLIPKLEKAADKDKTPEKPAEDKPAPEKKPAAEK